MDQAKQTPPTIDFETHFPNITAWATEYGHIQIGTGNDQESFIAAYDRDNEVVWGSADEMYDTLAEALAELEGQLAPYLGQDDEDSEHDDDEDDEDNDYNFSKPVTLRPDEINKVIRLSNTIQATTCWRSGLTAARTGPMPR
jgi:hypothetical protein